MGALLTALYIAAVAAWCAWHWPELIKADASKLGTFLGGVFSPIAFLWLVLGYFQQGEELRQNTRALELQAEELKHSVQHQAELVEVTRSQLQADISRLEQEQERVAQAAKPKLRFDSGGSTTSGGRIEMRLLGHNVGNNILDVTLSFDPDIRLTPQRITYWNRGETKQFNWALPQFEGPEEVIMSIDYVDASGTPGRTQFLLSPMNDGLTSWQAVEISPRPHSVTG